MSHARLAPSSASTWVKCPGSVTMQERFPEPEEDSNYALEGEACHHAAAEALLGRTMPCVGAVAPNGVVYTEECIRAAMVYIEAVQSAVEGLSVGVEKPVQITTVHPTDCWGTPDAFHLRGSRIDNNLQLTVDDLKYGWGIVEAEENWQLICYAIGIVRSWRDLPLNTDLRIRLRIIQPRPFHVLGAVREWVIDGVQLRHYETILQQAAVKALGPDPQCVSGAHCLYCTARHACPAAQRAAYAAMEYIERAQPHLADAAGLALMWEQCTRAEQAVKLLRTGLEGQITGMILSGQNVPGLTLERGKGRRAWDKPVSEVLAMGELMGKDLRAPVAAMTPTQARDAGIPSELINAYSSVGETGQKLVALNKTLAARVFGAAQRH